MGHRRHVTLTREQQAHLWGELPGPFEQIERDLGPAVATVWALYESTLKDACVMDWTLQEEAMEVTKGRIAGDASRTSRPI